MLAVVIVLSSLVGLVMNIDTKCEHCSCQVLVFSIKNSQTGPCPHRRPSHAAIRTRTARERVREEMTAEILAVAGQHVARDGAAALSLRSIARDLGMAPSALYRYFDGRDALLSALILGAYEALADRGRAGGRPGRARRPPGRPATPSAGWRCPAPCGAWALAHPHQWGLIFGTPVPGYQAPEDTVEPYARVAAALVRPLVAAQEAGRLAPGRRDAARVRTSCVPPWRRSARGCCPACRSRRWCWRSQAWTTIVGAISLEVFGHWRNTVLEPGLLFEAAVAQLAEAIGLH